MTDGNKGQDTVEFALSLLSEADRLIAQLDSEMKESATATSTENSKVPVCAEQDDDTDDAEE